MATLGAARAQTSSSPLSQSPKNLPAPSAPPGAEPPDSDVQSAVNGQRPLKGLSPQQQAHALELLRANKPRCRFAYDAAQEAATKLTDYTAKLNECLRAGLLNDDCATPYARLRAAYARYSDAAHDVDSRCR
jgi:hypothetical protein